MYMLTKVKVQNVSACWNGRIGYVIRWLHDSWYVVVVDGIELVLDSAKYEMDIVRD